MILWLSRSSISLKTMWQSKHGHFRMAKDGNNDCCFYRNRFCKIGATHRKHRDQSRAWNFIFRDSHKCIEKFFNRHIHIMCPHLSIDFCFLMRFVRSFHLCFVNESMTLLIIEAISFIHCYPFHQQNKLILCIASMSYVNKLWVN